MKSHCPWTQKGITPLKPERNTVQPAHHGAILRRIIRTFIHTTFPVRNVSPTATRSFVPAHQELHLRLPRKTKSSGNTTCRLSNGLLALTAFVAVARTIRTLFFALIVTR